MAYTLSQDKLAQLRSQYGGQETFSVDPETGEIILMGRQGGEDGQWSQDTPIGDYVSPEAALAAKIAQNTIAPQEDGTYIVGSAQSRGAGSQNIPYDIYKLSAPPKLGPDGEILYNPDGTPQTDGQIVGSYRQEPSRDNSNFWKDYAVKEGLMMAAPVMGAAAAPYVSSVFGGSSVLETLNELSPETANFLNSVGESSTWSNASNIAEGAKDVATGTGTVASGVQAASGIPTNGSQFLNSMEAASTWGAGTGGETAGSGLVNSALKFINENKTASTILGLGGMQMVGGALQGAANRENSLEQIEAKKKAEADLLAEKRSMIQGSGYTGTLPLSVPTTRRPLRRLDGTLVYSPNGGIVNRAV